MVAFVCLLIFVVALRLVPTSARQGNDDISVPELVQSNLRHGQDNVIAESIVRNLEDFDDGSNLYDDNPYVTYYDNYDEGYSNIVNQAQTEIQTMYDSSPSEWSMTEWEIFSSIFAFTLAILICCTVCAIRCCSIVERDDAYKSFDDRTQYSSDGSMGNVLAHSTRSRQVTTLGSTSRSLSNSTKESLISYDSTVSGASDKIMSARSS